MILHIRNMESARCIAMVKSELIKLGCYYKTVELGEVKLSKNVSEEKLQMIDIAMKKIGLELMGEKNKMLIEKIKNAVHQFVYFSDDLPKQNFTEYINKKFNHDYTHLSNLFSSELGITIEKYIIAQKIERTKELLVYTDISLNDIAFMLQYSSVAHLSNQFKKITGLTPSFFKQHRSVQPHK